MARNQWIAAFIYDIADLHIPFTSGPGELPNTGCPELAVGLRIKGTLYVGQKSQVCGQAMGLKDLCNVIQVNARALQPYYKAVFLPDLATDLPGCLPKNRW